MVDQQYLEATGLQQGQTSVDGRFPAIQPVSPQPANDASVNNQLSLSRTSNTSMTNSQSMHYSHRVRVRPDQPHDQSQRGATVEWYNLDYDVPVKSEDGSIIQRRLLNKVYGYCTPGM